MDKREVAVGIDLGTSKCCVGVAYEGYVEIVENERAKKTTPSYVAFTETNRLIGEEAKQQSQFNPQNTVYGIKRIMGQPYSNCGKYTNNYLPFEIKPSAEYVRRSPVNVKITYRKNSYLLSPEQISSMLLKKMKDIASERIGNRPITSAVISVPAFFNKSQREATLRAAALADLKVLSLIDEPTAVAINYSAAGNHRNHTFLVFDLGAGFLQASVFNIGQNRLKNRADGVGGALGGINVISKLAFRIGKSFESKHPYFKCVSGSKCFEQLKQNAERGMRSLSLLSKTSIHIESFFDGKDLEETINKEELGEILDNCLNSEIRKYLDKVLRRANLKSADVDEVVLVGGCSRIPAIQKSLMQYFNVTRLNKTVNADEAVAYGCTYAAAILQKIEIRPKIKFDIKDLNLSADFSYSKKELESIERQKSTLEEIDRNEECVATLAEQMNDLEENCFSHMKEVNSSNIKESLPAQRVLEECENLLNLISDQEEIDSKDLISRGEGLEKLMQDFRKWVPNGKEIDSTEQKPGIVDFHQNIKRKASSSDQTPPKRKK